MFESVRGCLFNTEPERELAHRLYPAFRPGIEAVVAMGIPEFEADGSAFARRHAAALAGAPYVIYCGRREPLKGTPLLVDYVDLFRRRTGRDVRLVLTGSGPVDVPSTLEGAVLDLGFVSEQEKREAMAGAVAFCHPSVNESLSIVLIESWLARTPALVHSNGAVLRDQCRRANGGLWFHNYPEFEVELGYLLDHPDVRRRLAESGREYAVRTYSPEAVTRRFLAALHS
jgi:glycosyltransferase involved in cell wall biosynthesis